MRRLSGRCTSHLKALLGLTGLALGGAPALAAACTVTPGPGGDVLIRAVVLTADRAITPGEVLVDGEGMIACVGATCSAGAPDATRIDCPDAILSPGFVNPHEHLAFGNIPPVPDEGIRYTHRHDWRKGLNGYAPAETFAPATDPDLIAWMELRHLLAGETAIIGGDMAPGLARNLDHFAGLEGLETPRATYSVFPLDDAAGIERTRDCDYGPLAATAEQVAGLHVFVVHLAEGVSEAARNEYRCTTDPGYDATPLATGGGVAQDILHENVTVLHGVGLDKAMLADLARRHVALVWSPRSNLALYGRTLDIVEAQRLGMPIALGTDWLFTGSMTLVREADCARRYSESIGHPLDGRTLWTMMTAAGARAARMSGLIGTIAPGAAADLILVDEPDAGGDPYLAAATAHPAQLRLIMRGGHVLSGDAGLVAALKVPGCESVDMAGRSKWLCLATAGAKGYTALKARADAAGLWPAFFADAPPVEPVCRTARTTKPDGRPLPLSNDESRDRTE